MSLENAAEQPELRRSEPLSPFASTEPQVERCLLSASAEHGLRPASDLLVEAARLALVASGGETIARPVPTPGQSPFDLPPLPVLADPHASLEVLDATAFARAPAVKHQQTSPEPKPRKKGAWGLDALPAPNTTKPSVGDWLGDFAWDCRRRAKRWVRRLSRGSRVTLNRGSEMLRSGRSSWYRHQHRLQHRLRDGRWSLPLFDSRDRTWWLAGASGLIAMIIVAGAASAIAPQNRDSTPRAAGLVAIDTASAIGPDWQDELAPELLLKPARLPISQGKMRRLTWQRVEKRRNRR